MKKIFAFIMILSLVLGSVSALAQEKPNFEIELELHLEPELMSLSTSGEVGLMNKLFGVDGEAYMEAEQQVAESTAALLNLITVKGVTNGNETEMAFYLKDKPILTLEEGYTADQQYAIVTNLLPSYALTFTEEELASYSNQDVSAKLMTAVEESLAPVMQIVAELGLAMNSHIQEAKDGTFEVQGNTYDQYMRLEMTAEEFWEIMNHAYSQMIPLMEKMLVALGMEEDTKAMEDAVTDAQDTALPEYLQDGVLQVELYQSSTNPLMFYEMASLETAQVKTYVVLAVNGNGAAFYGISGPVAYADRDALEQAAADGAADVVWLSVTAEADLAAPRLAAQVELSKGEMYQRHELNGFNTDTDAVLRYRHYQQKDGNPLAEVTMKMHQAAAVWTPVDTEGKKMVSYTELMDAIGAIGVSDEEEDIDYTILLNLLGDISKASNHFMIQAILAAPEEVQAYMNAQTALSNVYLYAIPSDMDQAPIDVPEEGVSF